MSERMIADFGRAHELTWAALRYFNAAGADPDGEIGEDHEPETHLVPLALRAAAGGERLTLFGDDYPTPDGTCIRDYIHVTDLAEAHVAAVGALTEGCESLALNLGTGKGISNRQILESVERVTGKAVPHDIGPRRPGDPAELVADPGLAAERLDWVARLSDIDTIVDHAWRWFQRAKG
jgi:UDP-glucose 4-epimerase